MLHALPHFGYATLVGLVIIAAGATAVIAAMVALGMLVGWYQSLSDIWHERIQICVFTVCAVAVSYGVGSLFLG